MMRIRSEAYKKHINDINPDKLISGDKFGMYMYNLYLTFKEKIGEDTYLFEGGLGEDINFTKEEIKKLYPININYRNEE